MGRVLVLLRGLGLTGWRYGIRESVRRGRGRRYFGKGLLISPLPGGLGLSVGDLRMDWALFGE